MEGGTEEREEGRGTQRTGAVGVEDGHEEFDGVEVEGGPVAVDQRAFCECQYQI
jgi:hypothetical protein